METTLTSSATGESLSSPFVVAGIGASAGGLEALEAFFSGLPKTDGVAFVVVLHLDPDRESALAEVLARTVPLPVTQVTEAVEVERGHVYVIPPNRNLRMEDGHLRLAPLEDERQRRRPVDHFFRTLAKAYGERAVAVILSGTGQNGTVGVRQVKESGGLVLAQAFDDALYDEMPRSAVAAGIVDHVLPAAALGREVVDYADRLKRVRLPDDHPEALPTDDVQAVQRILVQLRTRTGHDFAHYKRATILRRLARRMHVVGADTLPAYLDALREQPAEARELLADLLISVTNFFRDPEAFEVLERDVVPRLFEGKGPDDPVRVWVAGCATGEEAYTIAMLLMEYADRLAEPPAIQVFGTDLSEAAIRTAREGVYPGSIEADVAPDRLRRFFQETPGGYRVSEPLRERVLFAPHSLLTDPPFAHVGLVSCRNLLIYLQRPLQQRVLELFHYALEPGGTLFLGTSETAEGVSDLFQPEHKKARIYRGREGESAVPYIPRPSRPSAASTPPADDGPPAALSSVATLHQRLRAAAAPPSVLVDERHEIVHVSDGVAPFLRIAGGEPTRNVLRLIAPELRPALQTALFQARREGRAVTSGPIPVEGQPERVRVRVQAAEAADAFLVVFEAASEPAGPPALLTETEHVEALEGELRETREQIQLTIEEFETSREELRAQNEELQSMNEELRSTAEELETSKEEAQSVAEELRAVNDELKEKVDELARAKGDLENLIVSTEIATLFLDRQLRVQWFTPQIRRHFQLRQADVGRPLADFAQTLGSGHLLGDAEAVVERLEVREREVPGADGQWYLVHVRPYRSIEDRIDGVVVTFVDITERKQAEEALRRSEQRLQKAIEIETVGVVFWGPDVTITEANGAFLAMTGFTREEALGRSWQALTPEPFHAASERALAALDATGVAEPYEKPYVRKDGSRFWGLFAPRRLDDDETVEFVLDVTEQREAAEALRESEERYRLMVEGAREYAIFMMDPDGRITTWSAGAERIFGYAEAEALGQPGAIIFTEADRAAGAPEEETATARREGQAADDRWHVRKDGSRFWANGVMTALRQPDGALRGFAKILRDNTKRKEYEEALRQSEARYRTLFESIDEGFCVVEVLSDEGGAPVDYRFLETNPAFDTQTGLTDATGRRMRELVPDPEPVWLETFGAVAATGEPVRFSDEARALGRWYDVYAFPIGEPGAHRVAVLFNDVSERKRAEEALQTLAEALEHRVEERTAELAASEERFRALVSASAQAVWTADARGRIVEDAPAWRAYTGQTKAEGRGEGWLDAIHPDDRAQAEADWRAAVRAGTPIEAEFRLRHAASGTWRWTHVRAVPLRNADGTVRGWVGMNADIHERREAEERVRDLAQALTMAEQEERQRIAHILHDDLQQQLYGLSMTMALLSRVPPPESAQRLFEQANGTLDQAMTLTRTLATELSPAVLETDRLADVLEWVAGRKRSLYGLDIDVEVRGDPAMPEPALRVLLYQILREVLFNVVKHAETRRARITAWADADDITVEVVDEGVGFDASTLSEGTGRVGFGLLSARERLRLVGGRFEITSAPGEGTRVTLVIPTKRP